MALHSWVGSGVTADLGRYSPGANDNASAVGTLLALAERLKDQPLQNTALWLAFTGCEESGCDGMKTLIREHGNMLRDAIFIDVEMVGIGDRLSYIAEEGNLRRRASRRKLRLYSKPVRIRFGLIRTPRVRRSPA
jgi:Zn-dependent M28 family amino/carboxypeptidase